MNAVGWIAAITGSKHGEEATVGSFKNFLNSDITGPRDEGTEEPIASGKRMLNSFDHTLKLCRHETASLCTGDSDCRFGVGRGKVEKLGCRGGGSRTAKNGSGMPATSEKFAAINGLTDAGPRLEADDSGEQKSETSDRGIVDLGVTSGEKSREKNAGRVKRRDTVVVI